jgi:hypothetical protein
MEKSSPNGLSGKAARPPIRRILIFAIFCAWNFTSTGVRPPAAQQREIPSFCLAITFLMFLEIEG